MKKVIFFLRKMSLDLSIFDLQDDIQVYEKMEDIYTDIKTKFFVLPPDDDKWDCDADVVDVYRCDKTISLELNFNPRFKPYLLVQEGNFLLLLKGQHSLPTESFQKINTLLILYADCESDMVLLRNERVIAVNKNLIEDTLLEKRRNETVFTSYDKKFMMYTIDVPPDVKVNNLEWILFYIKDKLFVLNEATEGELKQILESLPLFDFIGIDLFSILGFKNITGYKIVNKKNFSFKYEYQLLKKTNLFVFYRKERVDFLNFLKELKINFVLFKFLDSIEIVDTNSSYSKEQLLFISQKSLEMEKNINIPLGVALFLKVVDA